MKQLKQAAENLWFKETFTKQEQRLVYMLWFNFVLGSNFLFVVELETKEKKI